MKHRIKRAIRRNRYTAKALRTIRAYKLRRRPFYRCYPPPGPYHWIEKVDKCSVVSSDGSFMYFRIPKAANSTIIASLNYQLSGRTSYTRQQMQHLKFKTFRRASDLSRQECLVARRTVFTFSFVRHPYARLVSAYNDKIIDSAGFYDKQRGLWLAKLIGKDVSEITFSDFLTSMEVEGGIYRNYHYAPQVDMMAIPPHEIDYIGKVESLDQDLPFVISKIFKTNGPIVSWRPHASRNSGKRDERHMNVASISPNDRVRIQNLFCRDFEAFEYEG